MQFYVDFVINLVWI